MKVLHVLRTGGAAYGVERTVLSILPTLPRRGVEVCVLMVGTTPAAISDVLRQGGCEIDVVETGSRFPLAVARTLRRICDREKPDILHSHGYKCDLASLLSRARARKVATVHGWCSRSTRERFYEWIDVQCLKRMDRVVALCRDYRSRLIRRGVPNRLIRVAHVGVDPDMLPSSGRDYRAEWRVGPDDLLATQIGRLSPEKDPALFVEVARRLAGRFPHVKFALIGDGQLTDQLRRDAAQAGVPVTFAGYISDVGDVFRATDVVVNCSRTEGLPGALLEAGVTGTPAVATAVGGAPEIIDDSVTGFLCPAGDADALAAALERLIKDGGLRASMGAAAQERVRTVFSIDACSQRLVEIYEELLA